MVSALVKQVRNVPNVANHSCCQNNREANPEIWPHTILLEYGANKARHEPDDGNRHRDL